MQGCGVGQTLNLTAVRAGHPWPPPVGQRSMEWSEDETHPPTGVIKRLTAVRTEFQYGRSIPVCKCFFGQSEIIFAEEDRGSM